MDRDRAMTREKNESKEKGKENACVVQETRSNYATQGRYSLKPGDGCIRDFESGVLKMEKKSKRPFTPL